MNQLQLNQEEDRNYHYSQSFFIIVLDALARTIKQEKKLMGIIIAKVKLALLLSNILSKRDPTNYTRKLDN